MRVAVLHGPNLRLLGRREPEVYGTTTLEEIDVGLQELADELGAGIETFQSNHEGELLDFVEGASERVEGFLVNAGAFTHTSVALRDALVGVGLPFVEVHLSNTAAREAFRRTSHLAPVAAGVVYGFGPSSYLLGLRGLVALLGKDD
ncbi:MAG: type II 3-dehydroquinate dehydratase [Gemmatimonadetes bacterium]|nr:type II 3-dehydroquinate dehydratase [Gemmatimonadota bacterium]